MASRLQKLPVTVYVPAVPGTPGRAAYCVPVTTTGSASGLKFGGGSSGGYQPVYDVPAGWGGVLDPGGYGVFSANQPTTQSSYVCYPAIPGTPAIPARVDQYDNFGWNGGARTISELPASGYFKGQLPASPLGVQLGISGRQFQPAYSAMSHSIVARRDEYTIVESGSTVFGPQPLPAASSLEVRRFTGVVSYWVNGSQVYQSSAPSQGEAYGAALLYSISDYVDSPEIVSLEVPISFSAVLPLIQLAASNGEEYGVFRSRIPRLGLVATLDVDGAISFSASLPAMKAGISDSTSISSVQAGLPRAGFAATIGAVEAIPTSMAAVVPPMTLSATLIGGQAIEFQVAMPAMIAAIGDQPFSIVRGIAPIRVQARIVEPYMPDGESDGSDAVVTTETAVLESALILLAIDSLSLESTDATLVVVIELSALDSVSISTEASLGSIVELLAMEQVAVISRSAAARPQALQYAVNFMTGALTTYRDFDFLGFTYDDGQAYAWRSDGLYLLEARGPGSEAINALVDFGASDYADAHLKRLGAAFVGVRSDGECYLRACADDGVERIYRLVGGGGTQRRTELAKGVSSRYWNVRLELTDASFASIDNVELEVGISQRRGYGRRG